MYQTDISYAISKFKDEIICFDQNIWDKAYPHFIKSIKQAYAEIYPKMETASVDTVLETIVDTTGQALQDFHNKMKPVTKPQDKVMTAAEKADTRGHRAWQVTPADIFCQRGCNPELCKSSISGKC